MKIDRESEVAPIARLLAQQWQKLPVIIVHIAFILMHILAAVGWIANLYKFFIATSISEQLWRMLAAIIFPIGSIYGYF